MNSYYLTLVLKADLVDEQRKTLLDAMVKKLTGDPSTLRPFDPSTLRPFDKLRAQGSGLRAQGSGQGGKVIKMDLWGARDLAYPIKRQTKGFFAHFEVEADPKNAKDLDKTLKVEEDILRYLLVRV